MIENKNIDVRRFDAAALLAIHKKTIHNAPSVIGQPNKKCACFGCKTFFDSRALPDDFFAEERDGAPTLLCPECCIDSVLVDRDGYELTEQLVDAMNQMFFGGESTTR